MGSIFRRKRLVAGLFIVTVATLGLVLYWRLSNQPSEDLRRVNQPIAEQVGEVEPVLEIVAQELGLIWAIDFIPESTVMLATQNEGKLLAIDTATLSVEEISGAPDVSSAGQGGLLDVTVAPDFDESSLIYLTYSAANAAGETTTQLAQASLDLDSAQLSSLQTLYVVEPFKRSTSHYGSRVLVTGEHLYMTIGDRGDKNFNDHVAQDTSNVLGSTIRLLRDGSIPPDNPFVGEPTVRDEIYSYGHRNAQGMALQASTGEIWQSEHGERDGDEINRIQAGGNYGWPVATHACRYGTPIRLGDNPAERDDLVAPEYYWDCGSGGFPPAGMVFYDADGFSDWRGDLFVGGLASRYLAHFRITETGLQELDPLLASEGWRIRDVAVGQADGAIYAAVEGESASIIRISPRPVAPTSSENPDFSQ